VPPPFATPLPTNGNQQFVSLTNGILTMNVIDKAGYELWFSCSRATDPDRLLNGLSQLSSQPPYVPEQRSSLECLQLALTDVCQYLTKPPIHYLVRPLAGRSGRHVFREVRGADQNSHDSMFTIRVPEDGDDLVAEGPHCPGDGAMNKIQSTYHSYQKSIGARAVKTIMVKEVLRLGGIKIDGKDAYFIPPDVKDDWEKIVQVALNAAEFNDSKFYDSKYELNGTALDAVQLSVEEEIVAGVDNILSELSQGQFTDRVQANRLKTLKKMTAKMQRYESLFGAGLQTCQYKLKEVLNAMNLSQAVETSSAFDDVLDDVLDVGV